MIVGINVSRRTLFIGLLVVIIISDSIIFFAEIKSKSLYSNWVISINASIAAFLAIFVIYIRKNIPGEYRDTRAALAIGLSLWLCADIIWAVYEIVLEIVPPVPSAADFLWLSAYGFLAYYLYRIYIEFYKRFKFSKSSSRKYYRLWDIPYVYNNSYHGSICIIFPGGIAMFAVIHYILHYGCSFNGSCDKF
jgi:hypothetical protein